MMRRQFWLWRRVHNYWNVEEEESPSSVHLGFQRYVSFIWNKVGNLWEKYDQLYGGRTLYLIKTRQIIVLSSVRIANIWLVCSTCWCEYCCFLFLLWFYDKLSEKVVLILHFRMRSTWFGIPDRRRNNWDWA
jgi:hypothetical protein